MKNIITSIILAFSVYSYSQNEQENDSIVETAINALDEIVISKKKVLYTQKSDRLVFNVENSIVSEGGTALDVLQRAPGVVVSQDGDLSIRGQQGVAVMINGKLTQLSQKELANYLKSTTSSNIKQIEVITNMFETKSFDSMTDSTEYKTTNFNKLFGGFDYVTVNRKYSEPVKRFIESHFNMRDCDESMQARRLMNETNIPANFETIELKNMKVVFN